MKEYHNLLNSPQFYVDDTQEYPKQIQEYLDLKQRDTFVFSFLEIIWISLVTDLIRLKISKKEINDIKKMVFKPKQLTQELQCSVLEYQIIQIFEKKSKCYVVVDQNGKCMILDHYTYCDMLATTIDSHICLSLNMHIKNCFGEVLSDDIKEKTTISFIESQLLDIIRNYSFTDMRITKKHEKIERVYLTEILPTNTDIEKLMAVTNEHKNIEIKHQYGKIVHIAKTSKIKIKNSHGKTAKLL